MIAFGGSGPVHAVGIARELGVSTVIVPPSSGVFSAVGLVTARRDFNFVQTSILPLDKSLPSAVGPVLSELKQRALESLSAEGFKESDVEWSFSADVRHVGQAHELTVRWALPPNHKQLRMAFFAEHERAYGYAPTEGNAQLVNVRLTAMVTEDEPVDPSFELPHDSNCHNRMAYFGGNIGTIEVPVFSRSALLRSPAASPMIIEEDDATCVVPPGCAVSLDHYKNVIIELS
ncbi:MAG: hypothetical protein O3B95_12425 [Chloroflexi bacterium]|nr:hypothetical protein [Chloroflexota bacterium]